eukprot:889657-Pyramimonas_sp.AAC.2
MGLPLAPMTSLASITIDLEANSVADDDGFHLRAGMRNHETGSDEGEEEDEDEDDTGVRARTRRSEDLRPNPLQVFHHVIMYTLDGLQVFCANVRAYR